jgi:hypothetical protein
VMTELIAWLIGSIARAALPSEAVDTPTETAAVRERASLAEPTVIAHGSDRGAVLLQGVAGVLDDQLSKTDRTRLGRKVLNKSRVAMAEGTFPASGTLTVTTDVPLRMKDPAAEPRFISGVFTLADDGALASIVVAPKLQNSRFLVTAIDDTDNDGHDDLQLRVIGPEGESERLVTWQDGHAN